MVGYSKEAALSRHMGMDSHSNSEMLKQHTLYILTGSNKISSWHREGQEDKRPTPNQAILCNWYLLGKDKTVFSDGITRYINYTAEQVTRPGVADLHKLDSLFFFCMCILWLWCFLCLNLCFYPFFFFILRERTWWVERWAGIWEELGERQGYD